MFECSICLDVDPDAWAELYEETSMWVFRQRTQDAISKYALGELEYHINVQRVISMTPTVLLGFGAPPEKLQLDGRFPPGNLPLQVSSTDLVLFNRWRNLANSSFDGSCTDLLSHALFRLKALLEEDI